MSRRIGGVRRRRTCAAVTRTWAAAERSAADATRCAIRCRSLPLSWLSCASVCVFCLRKMLRAEIRHRPRWFRVISARVCAKRAAIRPRPRSKKKKKKSIRPKNSSLLCRENNPSPKPVRDAARGIRCGVREFAPSAHPNNGAREAEVDKGPRSRDSRARLAARSHHRRVSRRFIYISARHAVANIENASLARSKTIRVSEGSSFARNSDFRNWPSQTRSGLSVDDAVVISSWIICFSFVSGDSEDELMH